MKRVGKYFLHGLIGAFAIYIADFSPRDTWDYWVLSFLGGVTTGCSLGALLCLLNPEVRK